MTALSGRTLEFLDLLFCFLVLTRGYSLKGLIYRDIICGEYRVLLFWCTLVKILVGSLKILEDLHEDPSADL